jgi:hypothetical protein
MRLLLIVWIIPTWCFTQPLNEITTKEQAENFVKENVRFHDHNYDSFVIDSVDSAFDNFKKGDFNHDGIEDLLIFGTAHVSVKKEMYKEDEIIIILGDRKKPRKANFPYNFFRGLGVHIVPYPKIVTIQQRDFIVIRYDVADRKGSTTFYDTLYIKNDHVMPFEKEPGEKAVMRIELKTTNCFGTCPVFEMAVNENLDVDYNGIEYVDKKGVYKLRLERKDWNYLSALIDNLRIEDLKDNYSINWTDHQTAFLTVTFKDGTKKKIEDYGLAGTFGLSLLYNYFFELKNF